jgi:hypothetical protein
VNPIAAGIRIVYRSNRLYSDQHRRSTENLAACLAALALLTGLTVEQLQDPEHPESIQAVGGSVDTYSSS